MSSSLLYENVIEEKIHLNVIQTLARETEIPLEDVGLLYEAVLERFKEHAKIKEFLPILVSREVKDILLHRVNLSLMEYRDDYL